MPYELCVDPENRFVRFNLVDKLTQEEIDRAMGEVLAIRESRKLTCILCDQRRLDVPPNQLAGFLTAEKFGTQPYAGTKLAIIRRNTSEERLFDLAASNRGVNIRIFGDEEEAKRWLAT